MSTYFTSDHHFGHAGALGLYRRPFASVAEMDRQMIDWWNMVVGPEDEVWHLGDFAFRQRPARVASLLKALHGRKRPGNNDDAAVIGCVIMAWHCYDVFNPDFLLWAKQNEVLGD